MRLAPRVTPRDREILAGLYDHHVMTTGHLHRLFFPQAGGRRVRLRMLQLHQYGLVDRFKPFPGRHIADHWVLAPTGAALVAEHRGVEISELGFRHDRVLAWAHSGRLGHILGLVECLALTTEAARALPVAQLVRWDNERECARRWGRHIRPDAYMRWHQGRMGLDAFWEYDTGTEPLTKVRRKMGGYTRLARETKLPSIVLFAVHSDRREEHLAAKLADAVSATVGVYVSTHARLGAQGPAEAVWRATDSPGRLRLVDIARRHPASTESQE
ncbi:replication-relaxation family protein [Nocardiopsis sp. CT-R113]|uniref:Replication-relaxation family protein n=1 Tax=Nocardiopsis codii TaxID=3065942 RepID=A0ABU7KAK4_9ACTN|nr:replication-relaxation family protein [Nocardiopsis sp. CT-R113]MEE2038939.1 replication-relaxation family protein [Nocardiopsis sp. CT-R113]